MVSKYISVFTIMRQSHDVWRGGGYMDICNMEPSWTDKEIGSSERYGTGLTPLNL